MAAVAWNFGAFAAVSYNADPIFNRASLPGGMAPTLSARGAKAPRPSSQYCNSTSLPAISTSQSARLIFIWPLQWGQHTVTLLNGFS